MRPRFRIPMAAITAITTIAAIAAMTLSLGAVAGCAKPASETKQAPSAAPEPSSSSAAKTEELERKADDYKARMEAIQSSDMTPEQKAQAASELVDEQQKTVQEADSSGSSGENPN